MNAGVPSKRRAHKRFIVAGSARLATDETSITGELVTLGGGGMLVRSDATPSRGSQIGVEFSVPGFTGDSPLQGAGTVVWTRPGKIGVRFDDVPRGFNSLLQWLENNNCSWSGIGK